VTDKTTLTTGIDNFVGTANNDTFDATQNATGPTDTLNSLDSLDGGAGNDTLKIVETSAIDTTALSGVSIKNIETANLTSTSTVTANTTGWTGLTALNAVSADDVALTASATTDVTVNASALTAAGGSNELTVNGGKNVTTTSADALTVGGGTTSSDIAIGGTTAASGAVKVTHTENVSDDTVAGADTGTTSTITVTGGTTIDITSNAIVGAAENAGDIATIGAISATGNSNTTSVSVTQSAATPVYDGTDNKNIKITNGGVTIADGNAATASDTINTVTLANYGASSIDSTVLSTLNLTGGSTAALASGALTLDQTAADESTAATALDLNMGGGFVGKIDGTQADIYETVNVASAADSTIADIEMDKLTTLNVSGAGITTFTALTDAQNEALTAINSTGGGLTIGTELDNEVAVTGGAGVETVSIGETTKAVNLGAGDDVATLSVTALGAGGSLAGGDGNDTLVMNTNGSATAGLPQISGFETLRVAGNAAQGTHNANGFTALEVGALMGADNDATFTNVAAGVGLTQLATMGNGNDLTVSLANGTGTNDSFGLTLKSAGAIGADDEIITANGVETLNITSTDTDSTAHVNKVEFVSDKVTTVSVSGNTGLEYLDASATITSFDASGVTLGKVTDTGVTFDSTNATTGAAVSIKGSNGVDVLTGSATANDTIEGGAGADTLVYDGGSDKFFGGAGNDTFDLNADGTKASHLIIEDLAVGDKVDFNAITDGTAGISDAAFGAKITLGAAATFDQYLNEAAKDTTDAGGDGTIDVSLAQWFQFEGNTYIVVDNSVEATFQDGSDAIVQVTGLTDLSTSTFTNEILTIA
jgi:S-layer protein